MIVKNYIEFDGNLLVFNKTYLYFPNPIVNSGNDRFFYPHICAIYRSKGQVDIYGNELFTGLYYGDCAYEFNPNGNTKLQGLTFQADSFLLIPSVDILFQINDMVMIEAENGRTVKATVKQFETVEEDWISGTTLWLKQAMDE